MSIKLAEREALKKVYRNPDWAKRVSKMSDEQVIAIYLRLKNQGKL